MYSPARTILEPSRSLPSVESRIVGGPGAVLVLLAELVEHPGDVVADVAQVAALDVHRQVDGRLQVDVVDLGGDLRTCVIVATFRSGIGTAFCLEPVIGMLRMSSMVWKSLSGYCTPTKYWLPLFGIDPEVLLVVRDAGVGGGDDVLHDVVLGQAEPGRLGPSTSMISSGASGFCRTRARRCRRRP